MTPSPTLQMSLTERPPASPSVGMPCSENPAGPNFPAREGGQAPSPMILISFFFLSMCCKSPFYAAQLVWPTAQPFPDVDTAYVSVAGQCPATVVVGDGVSNRGGWCREGELNPQGAKHRRILSPLRLPVPPSRLVRYLQVSTGRALP